MLATLAARFAMLVALSTLAIAQTHSWVVAPSLGAGVDFTRIQSAIDASVDGDVIRVRAGVYQPFTLEKALTIVGDAGARVFEDSVVQNCSSSYGVRLANLKFDQLRFANCVGPVLCDRIVVNQIRPSAFGAALAVQNCADVRFHRGAIRGRKGGVLYGAYGAANIAWSRVEFVSSALYGGDANGAYGGGQSPQGATGVSCQSSHVSFALTDVRGGLGDDNCCFGSPAGAGGDAIFASGGEVVIAGLPSNVIAGGDPGGGYPFPLGGYAVRATNLRYSGVTFVSLGNPSPLSVTNVTLAVPPDPTLELVGDPSAGAPVAFRLHAEAGLYGRLQQGDRARVDPDGLSVIPQLNNRIRIHHLGMVGVSGAIDYPAVTPTNAGPGWMRVFQGLEIDQPLNDLIERTNSVVVIAN